MDAAYYIYVLRKYVKEDLWSIPYYTSIID